MILKEKDDTRTIKRRMVMDSRPSKMSSSMGNSTTTGFFVRVWRPTWHLNIQCIPRKVEEGLNSISYRRGTASAYSPQITAPP